MKLVINILTYVVSNEQILFQTSISAQFASKDDLGEVQPATLDHLLSRNQLTHYNMCNVLTEISIYHLADTKLALILVTAI